MLHDRWFYKQFISAVNGVSSEFNFTGEAVEYLNQRVRQRGDHPACCKAEARERQLSAGLQHLEAATVPQLCVSTQVQ